MARGNLVQSVERALDIIETVAHAGNAIRLPDLASAIGLKATTVHNLAKTLVSRNYLEQDQRSWYRLGPAVAELARCYRDDSLLQHAAAVMQQLSTSYPQATVVLGDLVGGEIRLQLRLSPDRPHVMQRPLDQTFSPYASGIGLLFLAMAKPELRQRLEVESPFADFGAHLWQNQDQLESYLAEVRRQGYAVVPFQTQRSLRIACPIRDQAGDLKAAIGISLPPDTALPQLQQTLVAAAAQISTSG